MLIMFCQIIFNQIWICSNVLVLIYREKKGEGHWYLEVVNNPCSRLSVDRNVSVNCLSLHVYVTCDWNIRGVTVTSLHDHCYWLQLPAIENGWKKNYLLIHPFPLSWDDEAVFSILLQTTHKKTTIRNREESLGLSTTFIINRTPSLGFSVFCSLRPDG